MLGVKTAALPASLRRTNQRTVISLLLRLGSASRADLAKAAGISQPTAGKITTNLLRLGILQETGSTAETSSSGNGGPSEFGGGGNVVVSATGPGNAGVSPGSGASGAATAPSGAAQVGAAGAPGIVIVHEYS